MSETYVSHTKHWKRMQSLSESRGGSKVTKPVFSNSIKRYCQRRRKQETILVTTSGQFPQLVLALFFFKSLSAAYVLIKRCSSARQRDKAFLGKLCSASLFWITKLRTQKYLRIGIITCSLFTGYSDSVLLFCNQTYL